MKTKKWQWISVIAIFLISSLLHFIYVWFPNTLTSLFFPVNESIWEHNKIIIGAFLIWSIFEKLIFKKQENYLWSGFVSSIFCAILVMLIFTPVYFLILKTKDNIIVTFIIFLVAIYVSNIIRYKLLHKPYDKTLEKTAIIGFLIVMIINAYLSYNPLPLGIFYDYNKNIYGLG